MAEINTVTAREILDSRGNPTIEVEVWTNGGHRGRAAVPSGASTGAHEVCELRDGDPKRYSGKGVLRAVENVKVIIAPKLKGKKVEDQTNIDHLLLELDGTPSKSKLGANAILGVSLACVRAASLAAGRPLYAHMGGNIATHLPTPLMNILNGGAHADNGLDVQEFMVAPVCGGSFREALRAGSEVFQRLKKILNQHGLSTAVGDEGGFAPKLKGNQEALDLIVRAIEEAGYKPGVDICLALDVASTELFKDGKYEWEGRLIEPEALGKIYGEWSKKYPLVSIEDGFAEDDWSAWTAFTGEYGKNLQLVGDDLFVTNPKRIQMGINQKAANALLVKVNQIGTLTETANAIKTARAAGFKTVMSHRSGETEDSIIADLCVGMGCEQIKTGSLCRGERTAKYNQLLRIEEELGASAQFNGRMAFR